MDIIVKYSERGIIGEKEVEERKYHVEETLESIKDILRLFRRIVKKCSSKTCCFCHFTDLKNCQHDTIAVNFNTYDDIENDIVTVYINGFNYSDHISMSRAKAAEYIWKELQKNNQ